MLTKTTYKMETFLKVAKNSFRFPELYRKQTIKALSKQTTQAKTYCTAPKESVSQNLNFLLCPWKVWASWSTTWRETNEFWEKV